jgi:hypothetical protein
MGRDLKLLLLGLGVAVAIAAIAWMFRGQHDQTILERERWAADSASRAADLRHGQALDSLRQVEADVLARAKADSMEAARLRRAAAGHALADRAQDSALTVALSAQDSLPIVVGQRDNARLAYAGAVEADSVARAAARKELQDRLAIAEQRRLADSVAAAAHTASLLARNKELAGIVDRLRNRGKLFGLIPTPTCVVGYGAGISVEGRGYHGAQGTCGVKIKI